MTPPTCACAAPRPRTAADLNEHIRALARRAPLDNAEQRELARLWAEWQAARDAEDQAA